MRDQSFILFTHIEKTGGTTLHKMLHRNLFGYATVSYGVTASDLRPGASDGRPWFTPDQLARLLTRVPFRLSGLGGHTLGGHLPYATVIPGDTFRFAFLRDPVDRFLSQMNWRVRHFPEVWTPEKFIGDSRFRDLQTYRLGGTRDVGAAVEAISRGVDFVGLLERFDESLVLMRHRLGRPQLDIRYEPANVSPRDGRSIGFDRLPPGLQDRVLEANRLDVQLYDHVAKEVYPGYVAGFDAGELARDIRGFRHANHGFRTPLRAKVKRRVSNSLMRHVFQPPASATGRRAAAH